MRDRPSIGAAGLEPLLAGTILGGREILEVPVERTDDVALVIGIEEDELDAAWRSARALVDRTGRWPIQCGMDEEPDFLIAYYYERGAEAGLEADRRSQALGPADLLARHQEIYDATWRENWPEQVDHQLLRTRRRLGSAPSAEEVAAAIAPGDVYGLERWLLDHELGAGLTEPQYAGAPFWRSGGPCYLVLAPTARPATTFAYISWFAFEQSSRAQVIATVRSWHERFGAEPIAIWPTIAQFTAVRPPATIDEAFALAREHQALAPSTLWSGGFSVREYARMLLRATTWELHERP
jgi:hypothetical protein